MQVGHCSIPQVGKPIQCFKLNGNPPLREGNADFLVRQIGNPEPVSMLDRKVLPHAAHQILQEGMDDLIDTFRVADRRTRKLEPLAVHLVF